MKHCCFLSELSRDMKPAAAFDDREDGGDLGSGVPSRPCNIPSARSAFMIPLARHGPVFLIALKFSIWIVSNLLQRRALLDLVSETMTDGPAAEIFCNPPMEGSTTAGERSDNLGSVLSQGSATPRACDSESASVEGADTTTTFSSIADISSLPNRPNNAQAPRF